MSACINIAARLFAKVLVDGKVFLDLVTPLRRTIVRHSELLETSS